MKNTDKITKAILIATWLKACKSEDYEVDMEFIGHFSVYPSRSKRPVEDSAMIILTYELITFKSDNFSISEAERIKCRKAWQDRYMVDENETSAENGADFEKSFGSLQK